MNRLNFRNDAPRKGPRVAAVAALLVAAASISPTWAQAQSGGSAGHRASRHRTARNGAAPSSSPYIQETTASAPIQMVSSSNGTGQASSNLTASATLPGSVEPVMQRAARMLASARARAANAPEGARQSYQAAVTALQDLLAAGRFSSSAASAAGMGSAMNLPVSSTQVAEDIRLLRSASMGTTNSNQASVLNRAASLYATGVKEFITGELRDALLDVHPSISPFAATGQGLRHNGTVSAAEQARRASANRQGGVIMPDGTVAPGATGLQQNLPGPPLAVGATASGVVTTPIGGVVPAVPPVVVVDPNAVPAPPVVVVPPATAPAPTGAPAPAPPSNGAPPPATTPAAP